MSYEYKYRVIYGDTDKAGVVYYGTYMRLFEIGRTEYIRNLCNISYRDIEKKGFVLPVVELYSKYRSPAKYDDVLIIETSVKKVTRVTVSFRYYIRNNHNVRLVEGFTKHAVTDHDGRLTRMPDFLVNLLNEQVSDETS